MVAHGFVSGCGAVFIMWFITEASPASNTPLITCESAPASP